MGSQDEKKYFSQNVLSGFGNLLPQPAFEAKSLAKCHKNFFI